MGVWPDRCAEEQGFARLCAAPFFACLVYAGMEERNPLFPTRRLGVRVLQAQGEAASGSKHMVTYHLRPAAVKAGVLLKDDKGRFGFHNLRHSLASFLVRSKTAEDRTSLVTAFGCENGPRG